jgi:toxin-antitoxin system PIN domain toxin
MAGLIDTNILLYAANAEAPEHAKSYGFLMEAGQSAEHWYLTEGIVYEFLRVATHPRVFPRPLTKGQALAFLEPFWRSPAFTILTAGERHWELLKREVESIPHPVGNLFFDIRTLVLMREHGIHTVYTTDTDFLQFKEIEVVNPLTTGA